MKHLKTIFFILLIGFSVKLFGHGLRVWQEPTFSWLAWLGQYHYIFVHFPIALIIMTVVAEGFGIWTRNELFYQAARFMIVSAAFFAPPTALLGLALSDGQHHYEGLGETILFWHQSLGLTTAGLAIVTAVLLEGQIRGHLKSLLPYYICLTLLFVSVCWTGMLGGDLAFGF